jgi:hypothetical protein
MLVDKLLTRTSKASRGEGALPRLTWRFVVVGRGVDPRTSRFSGAATPESVRDQ